MSAQKAELFALTQALNLGKEKQVNIYIDSRYTITTTYVQGDIYQEKGLLLTQGETIKNK